MLVEMPTLFGAFTAEAAAALAQARSEAAVALDRLNRVVRLALPAFGTDRPPPAQGQLDVLAYTLAEYSPADYVTSGPQSEREDIVAPVQPRASSELGTMRSNHATRRQRRVIYTCRRFRLIAA